MKLKYVAGGSINTATTNNDNIIKNTNWIWANAQRDGRPAEHCGALCSTPQILADAHYLTAVQ